MEALRSYLTPNAKKARTSELEGDELSADGSEAEMEEIDEMEEPPWWAAQQLKLMSEMKDMMSSFASMQDDVKDIKDELEHVKLQSSLAQSTAQEAVDIATNVEDRVKALEDDVAGCVKLHDVQKLVDEAFAKLKSTLVESTSVIRATPQKSNMQDSQLEDKFGRTVVVGGFAQDTPKAEIVEFLNSNVLKDVAGVEEAESGCDSS